MVDTSTLGGKPISQALSDLTQASIEASRAGAEATHPFRGKGVSRWEVETPVASAIAQVLLETKVPFDKIVADTGGFGDCLRPSSSKKDGSSLIYGIMDPVENLRGPPTSVVGFGYNSDGTPPIATDLLRSVRVRKLICGPKLSGSPIRLMQPIPELVETASNSLGISASELRCFLLNRKRNEAFIDGLEGAKADICLEDDGDFMPIVRMGIPDSDNAPHLATGIGNTFQAITGSVVMVCTGGRGWFMQYFEGETSLRKQAEERGTANRIYTAKDLIPAETIMLAISGTDDSPLLKGVEETQDQPLKVWTLFFCMNIPGYKDGFHRLSA